MTLPEYISNGFPSYQQACDYALVFDSKAKTDLFLNQENSAIHKIEPMATADGLWFIRAAILSECDTGIFSQWFNAIKHETLSNVEVLPFSELRLADSD